MRRFLRFIRRLSADEAGPTAVEYAVMLALILITVLISVQALGIQTSTNLGSAASALSGDDGPPMKMKK